MKNETLVNDESINVNLQEPIDYSKLVPIISHNIEFNKLNSKELILYNTYYKHYLDINFQTYNLIQLVDGVKNLDEIALEYNHLYDKNIDSNSVYDILYVHLSIYGVLEGHEFKIKTIEKPSYLKLSFIVYNEKFLSKIVKYFYFLFHRNVAIIALFIAISSLGMLVFFNSEALKLVDLRETIGYFIIIYLISSSIHELGHATAANYFGAKHGGIGIGFYIFMPVYFADVTDVWHLKKSQRIIVNISGVYFEIIFCFFFTLICFLLKQTTLIVVSFLICVKTLRNLVPFLRSDGYWVLADLTDTPNLYHHSIRKIKELFNKIFRGYDLNWGYRDVILLIYGILTMLMLIYFVFYIVLLNPLSMIFFYKNFIIFFEKLFFTGYGKISIKDYLNLILPLIFINLIYHQIKKMYTVRKLKHKAKHDLHI